MNNFKTGKNLFGISKYGSSGLYVDLITNQSISGIKRFLSNLITNSDVNFNTTGNIGRIVFKPNEPPGFGGNLVAIYTTDENDGQGWIFSDGFLYYLGTGFISQKIIFNPVGNIDAVGSITGSSLSAGTGSISTTGNVSAGSLFVGSGNITGGALSATTGNFSSNVNITGASNGLIISGGFSGLFCNKIESQSGGAIVSSAIFNLRSALAITNITLDPLNTIRLKINGITGTNSYLFFNNSNTLGFFNTSTNTNTYTITDLGAISCSSLNASSTIQTTSNIVAGNGLNVNTGDINAFGNLEMLSTAFVKSGFGNHNTINPYSGTTINIGITSNFNWLKSVGLNRIKFFPSSTTGDIIQILRVDDSTFLSGYHFFDNSGTFGYISGGSNKYRMLDAGIIECNTFSAVSTNTYKNKFDMTNLFIDASIGSIDFRTTYMGFAHPSLTLSITSKYGFLRTFTNGDTGFQVNNVSGFVWVTEHLTTTLNTDYTICGRKASFTSGYRYNKFLNGVTEIGSITMLTASTVAFNQSSDYRLKQDIKPLSDSLDRLMLLRPKSYRFIHDVESGQDFTFDGFIAHEVENIIPMAVTGVKDDPNMIQQMDYSKLTPLLTGAVQELNEKVDKQQKLIEEMTKRLNKQEEMIQNLIMLINNKE